MDQTHIHLVITHLPIFGCILGAFALAHAIYLKSRSATIAAYNVLLLSAVGGVVAFLTGEAAEETAEKITGVAKAAIENHEESAELTIFAIGAVGIAAVIGLFLLWQRKPAAAKFSYVVLLLSLACFGMASWTGYLGGQIRHTEVHGGAVAADNDKGNAEMLEEAAEEAEELREEQSEINEELQEEKSGRKRKGRDH